MTKLAHAAQTAEFSRRSFLIASGLATGAALAGCEPQQTVNPDAVDFPDQLPAPLLEPTIGEAVVKLTMRVPGFEPEQDTGTGLRVTLTDKTGNAFQVVLSTTLGHLNNWASWEPNTRPGSVIVHGRKGSGSGVTIDNAEGILTSKAAFFTGPADLAVIATSNQDTVNSFVSLTPASRSEGPYRSGERLYAFSYQDRKGGEPRKPLEHELPIAMGALVLGTLEGDDSRRGFEGEALVLALSQKAYNDEGTATLGEHGWRGAPVFNATGQAVGLIGDHFQYTRANIETAYGIKLEGDPNTIVDVAIAYRIGDEELARLTEGKRVVPA